MQSNSMRFILLLAVAPICIATPDRKMPLQSKEISMECSTKSLDLGRNTILKSVATTPVSKHTKRYTAVCSKDRTRRPIVNFPRGGGDVTTEISAQVAEATPLPTKPSTAELCAKVLGVCVTVGSFTLKLPQIYQCVNAQSVEVLVSSKNRYSHDWMSMRSCMHASLPLLYLHFSYQRTSFSYITFQGLSLWSHYFELNMYLGSIMYHHLHRWAILWNMPPINRAEKHACFEERMAYISYNVAPFIHLP